MAAFVVKGLPSYVLLGKRHIMSKATDEHYIVDEQRKNIITDVPPELVKCFAQFLDVKSLVMFNCACQATCDADGLKRAEVSALQGMLDGVVKLSKEILEIVSTREGQDRLLASILRKLIYISVSDLTSHSHETLASTQTLSEYNALMESVTHEMDISLYAFNDLLEDAQFEFRGFNIINICKERRDDLDKIKALIRSRYFAKSFTVHTYSTFGATCIEFNCNVEKAMFDVHQHLDEETSDMMFLNDKVTALVNTHPEDELVRRMAGNIEMVHYMMHWNIDNHDATKVMASLMTRLMDCSPFYKGSSEICMEVWNDTMEENWVLSQVVEEVLTNGMYAFTLKDITDECTREYRDYNASMLL